MTARPRALGTALVAAMIVLAGCGQAASPTAAPAAAKRAAAAAQALELPVAADAGRVEIRVQGLAARKLMATTADVASLKVTLSGGPLAAPTTKTVTAAQLSGGKGTVAFDAIPNGTVNVAIEALDAGGAKVGEKATTAAVTGGQTAVVAVALKLVDTHVTSTDGNLALDLEVQDGAVVVDPIASPSPRPSSPVLSPAPSPTPAPTAAFAVSGELERTWFADGTVKVKGKIKNTGGATSDAEVTVTWSNKGLFGTKTVETQTLTLEDVAPGRTASFTATSAKKVANLFGQGAVDVTVGTP